MSVNYPDSEHGPDGMAEWLRRETSEPGVLGSNSAQVIDCAILPGLGGYTLVRDCLLLYNSHNSLRLVLLVITWEHKQINYVCFNPYTALAD